MKQKTNEPLLVRDIDMMEEEVDSPQPQIESKPKVDVAKEKMIENFNSGNNTQKFFAPRKLAAGNKTGPQKKGAEPSPDFIKNLNQNKPHNQTQKFVVKKLPIGAEGKNQKSPGKLVAKKAKVDDNSQKDVIVRRIKKKGEKNSNSMHGNFGHKKSNSEMINSDKNSSFKNFKHNQNSVNIGKNSSMAANLNREGHRSQHYKKALDKFQEFKKEQQMIRKNTPITKYRKGSAKKASLDLYDHYLEKSTE
jgi:hypothetical protein